MLALGERLFHEDPLTDAPQAAGNKVNAQTRRDAEEEQTHQQRHEVHHLLRQPGLFVRRRWHEQLLLGQKQHDDQDRQQVEVRSEPTRAPAAEVVRHPVAPVGEHVRPGEVRRPIDAGDQRLLSQFDVDGQRAVQPHEDRQLQEHRGATGQRVEAGLLLQGLLGTQPALHVVLVLLRDLLHLRCQLLHFLRVHRGLAGQRKHQPPDTDGQQNDGDRIIPDAAEEVENAGEQFGEIFEPAVIDDAGQSERCEDVRVFWTGEQPDAVGQRPAGRHPLNFAVQRERAVDRPRTMFAHRLDIAPQTRGEASKVRERRRIAAGEVGGGEVLRVDADVFQVRGGVGVRRGEDRFDRVFRFVGRPLDQVITAEQSVRFAGQLVDDVACGGPPQQTPRDLVAVPPTFQRQTVGAFQAVAEVRRRIRAVFDAEIEVDDIRVLRQRVGTS